MLKSSVDMATVEGLLTDRIVVDPQIMTGKPVVKGTRIPVELVLKKLANNLDFKGLLADYPRLTLEDIQACLIYAQTDPQVLAIAREEARVVITNDKDFGEPVFRQRLAHRGVILWRIKDDPIEAKQSGLMQALQLSSDQLKGFVLISERGIRTRPVPAQS